MIISSFPKAFIESFSLSDLRIVCNRIEEYCYSRESSKILPFIKWEQTLGIQKFNKRVLRDADNVGDTIESNSIKPSGYSDFGRNRFSLIDFDSLKNKKISNLLSEGAERLELSDFSILPSKCYLVIARKDELIRFIQKLSKDNFYLSWVGLDPNLRIQTGMNNYVEVRKIYDTCFAIVKT